jgi:hypothetical protein
MLLYTQITEKCVAMWPSTDVVNVKLQGLHGRQVKD